MQPHHRQDAPGQASPVDAGKGELQVWRDAKRCLAPACPDLHQVWDAVSWKICQQRDNPACADSEHAAMGDPSNPGLHVQLTFDPLDDVAAPFEPGAPRWPVLREQGVNSHVEMAYAFTEAGFEAFDVHMTDLQAGRARLADFAGVVACGASATATRWARALAGRVPSPSTRPCPSSSSNSLAVAIPLPWACNGCQMFAELADIIPGAQAWPRFTTNQSHRFEARLSMVEVLASPACSCRAWRQPPAHRRLARRGLCQLRAPRQCRQGGARHALRQQPWPGDRTVPVQPQRQPWRPDRRDHADGRFTAMMPHPERAFRNIQMSWTDLAATGGRIR